MRAKMTGICPSADPLGSTLCAQEDLGKSLASGPAHPRASALAVGQTRKAGTSRSCKARLVPLGSQVPGSEPIVVPRSIEWCEIGRHLPLVDFGPDSLVPRATPSLSHPSGLWKKNSSAAQRALRLKRLYVQQPKIPSKAIKARSCRLLPNMKNDFLLQR